MDIDAPLRELGPVDIGPLRDAIFAQDTEAWLEQAYRQQNYDVHRQTESIVLVFTDGSGWPELTVTKEPGWDRLAKPAVAVMQTIIGRHFPVGGTIIRAMAAKLLSGGKIPPHRDSHPSFQYSHRIHVPITTNPRVRFIIDGKPYKFDVGQAYELNNQKMHSVMNKGSEDRITFIFDYVPAAKIGQKQWGQP